MLALAAALIPLGQARIDAVAGRYRAQEEVLYLWSGDHGEAPGAGLRERLRPTSTGCARCSTSAASGCSRTDKRFELLRPLIDITTTLDPRMEIAYRYGAIFLSEPPPLGAGRPREGIEVLEQGVARAARRRGGCARTWASSTSCS